MVKDYDKMYSGDMLYWGETPSDLVRQFAELAPEGRALDLGMGEGRDVLYLAQLGYDVTGVELSGPGIARCQQRANELGREIKTVCADVRAYEIPARRYAIIVCNALFQFIDKKDARKLVGRIANGLKKGGIFLCQTFTIDDPYYKVHRRKSKEIAAGVFRDGAGNIFSLYGYGELLQLCSELRPIYYREYDFYDTLHQPAHWHGVVDYVGRRM
jgi:tellurite methyltransferase